MTSPKQSNVGELLRRLRESATVPKSKHGYFFRTGPGEYAEHDRFLGVTNPVVREIAKDGKNLDINEVRTILESKYNEERFLALVILVDKYKSGDSLTQDAIYKLYLENTQHVNNWNLVDTSAHLIVGPHLLNRDRSILSSLASSSMLWERRIAIVATLHFIRNNDLEWTFKLATQLLGDEHDLMHKAVGWMLREAGKKDTKKLLGFLDLHAPFMPRTMLRYSIEKLTPAQKKLYMNKTNAATTK